MNTKRNILFIQEKNSIFNAQTPMFQELYESVEKTSDEQVALKLIYKNNYDVIINDMSENPVDGTTFMKQIREMKPEQKIVTLFASEDEDKIGDIIDAGIDAFVLTPEQFDQALEAISQISTVVVQKKEKKPH